MRQWLKINQTHIGPTTNVGPNYIMHVIKVHEYKECLQMKMKEEESKNRDIEEEREIHFSSKLPENKQSIYFQSIVYMQM